MIVYKVTQTDLTSAIVAGMLCTKYEVGKWAKPPMEVNNWGYGLFCFDTLENAIEFAKRNSLAYGPAIFNPKQSGWFECRRRVWKASATGKMKLPEIGVIGKLILNTTTFKEELERRKKELEGRRDQWPKGTIMFKRVKLIEEVIYDAT
jgi:hypothetical protein